MRAVLVIVVVAIGSTLFFNVLLPFAKKHEPGWFPDEVNRRPAVLGAIPTIVKGLGIKKCGGEGVDTNKLTPKLPRITTPQTIWAFITAYDGYDAECVGDNAGILPRKTPGGGDVEKPGVAVDPEVIPYGSRIDIPGWPTMIADDTGCAMRLAARSGDIKNFYHLDIRIPAPYEMFTDPEAARREAHVIASHVDPQWVEVRITPPDDSHPAD